MLATRRRSYTSLTPPPSNTVLPVVSGTAQVGLPLSVSNGTWTNSPTGFTYQWTSGGTPIGGATASSYTLVGADNGNTIACTVTASNAGGSGSASATGVVVSPAQFALVGTAGAVTVGASGAAVTPAWGAGQTRAANNLLICWVDGWDHSSIPATPAGWSIAAQDAVGTPIFGSATVFYKIATGGDAQPTIALVATQIWAARLAEFQGNAHVSPLDQVGVAGSAGSPKTATLAAPDVAAGELVISAGQIALSTNAAVTSSTTLNNGATATSVSNDGSSTVTHYNFSYGITTGNSGADTAVVASAGGTLNGIIVAAASFKLAT